VARRPRAKRRTEPPHWLRYSYRAGLAPPGPPRYDPADRAASALSLVGIAAFVVGALLGRAPILLGGLGLVAATPLGHLLWSALRFVRRGNPLAAAPDQPDRPARPR
jgi:hypothetical protein